MEYQEIKRQSNIKVLLRGKSGYGKTLTATKVALMLSKAGYDVLYADTEQEGSTTIVELVEEGSFSEEDVSGIEYRQVESFDDLMGYLDYDNQRGYDLIIVDTLDHKHTFAVRKVTSDRKPDADWNQYPKIYDTEKRIMEKIGKPKTNVLCTLDPQSGSMDKPKGAQTNVHGYFTAVFDLNKSGDEWSNIVRNFVGRSDAIGKTVADLPNNLADKIKDRSNNGRDE
jgi:hypothetical protein